MISNTQRIKVILTWGIVLGLTLACGPAWAQIYKWVDDKGVTHFSDQPPQQKETHIAVESLPAAPPSASQSSETAPVPPSGESRSAASPAEQNPKSVNKVELYITSWCRYCKMARDFLRSKGVAFVEYDIEKDRQAAVRRREIEQRPGVPLAVINGQKILGFSEAAYLRALQTTQ